MTYRLIVLLEYEQMLMYNLSLFNRRVWCRQGVLLFLPNFHRGL